MRAKITIITLGVIFAFTLLFNSAPVKAALTTSQVDAIILLLESFGAESDVISNVRTSLTGSTPTSGGSFCPTLKYNLYSHFTS